MRSVDVANDTTAFALTGDDIAANAIDNSEITNGAIDSIEVQDGTLGGPDIADGGLSGQDIATNALTGDGVNESTLGQVPSALAASLGGSGRSAGGGGCDPESDAFVTCQAVSLTLPAPSRVLIIGRIRAFTESDAAIGRGACRVGTSVTGGRWPLTKRPSRPARTMVISRRAPPFGVSPVVGPGVVSFGIDCQPRRGGRSDHLRVGGSRGRGVVGELRHLTTRRRRSTVFELELPLRLHRIAEGVSCGGDDPDPRRVTVRQRCLDRPAIAFARPQAQRLLEAGFEVDRDLAQLQPLRGRWPGRRGSFTLPLATSAQATFTQVARALTRRGERCLRLPARTTSGAPSTSRT